MSHAVRDAPPPLITSVQAFAERADRDPRKLVGRLREPGLFGAPGTRAWGGVGLDVTTQARIIMGDSGNTIAGLKAKGVIA